jgi:hypothetical protein
MNRCRIVLIIFCLTLLLVKVHGTAQRPDYLLFKGDTLAIFSNPLESYFKNGVRPDSVFQQYGCFSTNCWRGYVGYWELKNDSLFLLELHANSNKIDLSLIFKDKKTDKAVFADWVNHSINNPFGKLIHYIHEGYSSIYEFEREFIFSNGVLTKISHYDNSKSKKSKFAEDPLLLKSFLKANINSSNFSNNIEPNAKVIVKICNVTEFGKVDSVEVIRGCDFERNMEAIRVVKLIPEWDVIYRHGKQIQIPWVIPIEFE